MVKYKTIKEIGKYSDYDMKKYNEINEIRIKRNRTIALYGFADLPITIFIMFGSIALSSILSWLFITESLIKTNLIIVNTYNFGLLFACISIISMVSILLFTLGALAIAVLSHRYKKQKDIDEVVIDEQ